MRKNTFILIVAISLLLGLLTICLAQETFTVPASQEVDRIIALHQGDSVNGNIEVSGGTGNDINFYVTDPHNNILLQYNYTSDLNFSFVPQTTGTYILHFDNSFSNSQKSVTLSYSVFDLYFAYETAIMTVIIGIVVIVVIFLWFHQKQTKSS